MHGIAAAEQLRAQASKLDGALQGSVWRGHFSVLIPILLIYFFLAFYHIEHQSLWVDEVISVMYADPARPILAHDRWFGGRGPLYHVLLQLWAKWGRGEFALRSFSAVLGGLTVCLAYMTGLRLCDRRAAGIGALLLATSPFLIWYSQEVRYIMLMIATALLAVYTFHLALLANRPQWWLLYCGSLILAIAAFVVNILLPVAHGLYLVCSPSRRHGLRQWVACQLVVFALFSWWANDGHIGQLGGYWQALSAKIMPGAEPRPSPPRAPLDTGGSRAFTVLALPYTLFAFSAGFSLGPSVRELQVSRSMATLGEHALSLSIFGLLFGSLFLLGVVHLWRQPDVGHFLMWWLAVPIIGTLGVSALMPGMAYNVRYVAMSWPAYILILAVGIASLRRPMLRIGCLAAVLLLNGLSLVNYYASPQYSREDARSAAQYLAEAAQAGDMILVIGNWTALRYYYKGNAPILTLNKTAIVDRPALTESLQELKPDHDRIWLVEIRPWEADPDGQMRSQLRAALDAGYRLIDQKEWPGVMAYAYRLH